MRNTLSDSQHRCGLFGPLKPWLSFSTPPCLPHSVLSLSPRAPPPAGPPASSLRPGLQPGPGLPFPPAFCPPSVIPPPDGPPHSSAAHAAGYLGVAPDSALPLLNLVSHQVSWMESSPGRLCSQASPLPAAPPGRPRAALWVATAPPSPWEGGRRTPPGLPSCSVCFALLLFLDGPEL